ncbi:HAMP domain-containing sensor histidine kinase [Desulfobacterales bacterium HSG2]|nr:HAMP domain-containing sensor histidine kinase [Desulfobacterales bacterium HSG2]
MELCNELTWMILSNLRRASELIRSFKQVAVDQSGEKQRKFNRKKHLNEILRVCPFEQDDAGNIFFDIDQIKKYIVFRYSDDGKGIPEENVKKIFDLFFTTRRGQGVAGLGLHIVYNIVTQKFGGTIRCESAVGQRTTFTTHFPVMNQEGYGKTVKGNAADLCN